MKKFRCLVILFVLGGLLVFAQTTKAQKKDNFLSSKLLPGCPKEIEFIKDQIHLSEMTYAFLSTGIDTLDAMFGEFNQQGNKGYWIAFLGHKQLKCFTTAQLLQQEGSAFPSNRIDISFDDVSKKIAVQITHNTTTNKIEYSWLNNHQKSRIAKLEDMDVPLQKNKLFPPVKVQSLDGKTISLQDFKGKYIVINWWTTGCAPCRLEMPGMNKLVEKYKSNPDVVFIAIAHNQPQELKDFLKSKEFRYVQTTGDAEISKVFGKSFPKNIIVNPKGVIIYYSVGGSENKYLAIDDELTKQINLLKVQ